MRLVTVLALVCALVTMVRAETPLPPKYVALYRAAVAWCPLNKRPTEAQQELVEKLLRIEAEEAEGIDLPPMMRGLLASASCHESAYKLRVGCGDGGASCGVVQLSATPKRMRQLRGMGAQGEDPRLDIDVAPRYYLRLVGRMRRIVRRDCRGTGGYASKLEYEWASAVKTATWKYRCGKRGRCIEWRDGECKRHACVRQGARCAVHPKRWKRKGKNRRQETWHTITLRRWRQRLEVRTARAGGIYL